MKNALCIIDVQNIYKNGSLAVEDCLVVVDNINKLIEKSKAVGDLIIYIKHLHCADGSDAGRMFDYSGAESELEFVAGTADSEFIQELKVVENAPIIIKNRYDAFVNTDLDSLLKTNGIEKITVCGFMTNFCCESTARHAHDLDYFVDFAGTATGTPGTDDLSPKETIIATLATLFAGFARII
jgi:nicotinamidase-related amidase